MVENQGRDTVEVPGLTQPVKSWDKDLTQDHKDSCFLELGPQYMISSVIATPRVIPLTCEMT